MSLNLDHDLEYRPGQDNEFMSSYQDFHSTQFLGQPGAFESVVDPCPINFEDWILYPEESYEDESSLDPSSFPRISGQTRMDQSYDEAEAMLTFPTDTAMLPLFPDTFDHVGANMEQRQLLQADNLSNSQYSVEISNASAFAPWNHFQLADNPIPEHSQESEPGSDSSPEHFKPLSSSGSEDADHKKCVPRVRFFDCQICARVFTTQARLSAHKRQIHAPRRFSCACGKMFHLSKDLRRHEITHNGEPRDFACTCGKDYLRHDHLLRHISNMDKRPDNGNHKAITA